MACEDVYLPPFVRVPACTFAVNPTRRQRAAFAHPPLSRARAHVSKAEEEEAKFQPGSARPPLTAV